MSLLSVISLPLRLRPRFTLHLPVWLSSLRSQFMLFIVLFCLLQFAGVLLLNQHVNQTQHSLQQASQLRERLALLDKARIELLTASDNSHRAGIYLIQDQQSGSVDSWKSLAAAATTSLQQAQQLFAAYQAKSDSPLAQGFVLLAGGLQEQLKGLAANDINAFFMVPMQAFQQQFNDAWFSEIEQANQQLGSVNQHSLSTLKQSRNLALAIAALLMALLLLAAALLMRGVLLPLRHANAQLAQIATGDLVASPAPTRRQSLETRQLLLSIDTMRQGLQQIVSDITTVATRVAAGADEMQQHNQQVMQQHQAQNASFHHLSQRLHRVSEEVEKGAHFSQQATHDAQSADALMRHCAHEVDNMEHQMQQIVAAAGDIAGIVGMLDSLSMQTRLLSLNAAIESAHAGAYGRSFSVVAKEMGLLSQQSGASTRQIDGLIQHTQQHVQDGFAKVQALEVLFARIGQAVSGVVSQLNELQDNSTAQSHRVSKIAREVVEMSLQLQQNEALTDQQVQAAAQLSELSARLTQRAQQFRVS
ncbi:MULTISPECIES: methyl-accepting chemotaxis protein [unclassified Pantoea]|uniref:methyl-accepting chemotaxis protein n=1 Tax=unclassified Pantoea TaxID=2630326 RepID=UPI001231FA18|nr:MULTISPECIES: methyl-accepting chemotaxis protein [unclassified Pantoea]KAA6101362.1 chemoreceptor [Pantoea sp. B_9]KAA6109622.1 chemoreceptor [Pantoea sp. B_10]